jgi:CcmD family protein
MKKSALIIFCLLAMLPVFGQQTKSLDEKLFEQLHGHASFNAVFVVVLIILGGVLFYLWNLDRKVNKLLKEVKK